MTDAEKDHWRAVGHFFPFILVHGAYQSFWGGALG